MVGDRFIRNLKFIRTLKRTKSDKKRQHLLSNATSDEIFALMDANYNILKFNFPLKPTQRRKLALYANTLRKLIQKRNSESGRRILQKGNGPMFAALLTPILVEAASRLISSFGK